MVDFIKKYKAIFITISILLLFVIILIIGGEPASKSKTSKTGNTKINEEEIKSEFDMTEEEQMKDKVYKYLNYKGTYIYDYDYLSKYPKVYEDILVNFYMYVIKVVEENNNNYKILVGFSPALNEPMNETKTMMIEGKYENGVRYATGTQYNIYGIFKGIKTYNIDGSTQVVPKIKVDKYFEQNNEYGTGEIYDKNEIKEVAKQFFNNNQLSVNYPNYDYDSSNGVYYANLAPHYLVTLESNNNKFNQYRFYSLDGQIEPVTENDMTSVERSISKTKDNGDYLLLTYLPSTLHIDLQRYNKNFELVWTREFENVDNYNWDVNNGRIALNTNNELFYINEDGKDILDNSIMVPNCLKLKLLLNGDVIYATDNGTHFINYIDANGKLIWRQNNNYDPLEVNRITVANNRIYVNHKLKGDDYNAYITVFTKDGDREITTKQ